MGGGSMITLGSISRDQAAEWFPFLAEEFKGRRTAIRQLTHDVPEFVFWIYPDGRLHNAGKSHKSSPPSGFEHILKDEPDYGGFLRGRVVRHLELQLVVVYCREEALASNTPQLKQLLKGLEQLPFPLTEQTLVISDNADIYGLLTDLWDRLYT